MDVDHCVLFWVEVSIFEVYLFVSMYVEFDVVDVMCVRIVFSFACSFAIDVVTDTSGSHGFKNDIGVVG